MKTRELELKQEEFNRSSRLNPVTVGVIAAAIGLFGNVVVSFVNAGSSLQQTKRTDEQQLALEQKKAEGALIMDAMKPMDINDRCRNLLLVEGLGLTDVSTRITALCGGATIYNSLARASSSHDVRSSNGQVKPVAQLQVNRDQ